MRTKLLGAFIAALSIAAFAALASMAMAENVTLKEGANNLEVGATVRATSTDTTFVGRPSGLTVACAKTSIRAKVRKNPGARLTFRNEGVFQNAAGGDQCAVGGSGGRLTARVENLTFRKDINLRKREGTTHITGRTEARFTFRFFDGLTLVASCSYEGKLNVRSTVGSTVFHAESEEDAVLDEERVNSESCDTEGFIRGNFKLTRRDGTTEVKTN
jgi:hypothetical protein